VPAPAPVPEAEADPGAGPATTPAPGLVPPPHWTAAPALVGTPPASPAATAAMLAAGREQATTPARRVELARAYLDLGDEGAARELLREVLDGPDPVASELASRMLREL
jgi:pilus assembly protein FimV